MSLVRLKKIDGTDYQNIFIDPDNFVPKPVENSMETVGKNFPAKIMVQVLGLMDDYDNRIFSADESGKKSFLFHKTTPLKDGYHISIFFRLYGYRSTGNTLTFVPITNMARNNGNLEIRVNGGNPIGFNNEDDPSNPSFMTFGSNQTQYNLCFEILGIGEHKKNSNAEYKLWVYNNDFFKGGVCNLDKL